MKLQALARAIPDARIIGDPAVEVERVVEDSRMVRPGDLFVAVRGLSTDGHRFAAAAAARGAAAVAVEAPLDVSTPQLVVPHGGRALGVLAAAVAGRPADKLRLVGVTGTNGKTTTTYLIESILAAAGAAPGVLGTVSYRFGGTERPAPFTTPTPELLHQAFGEMAAAGSTDAVLEVSSAALAMDRLAGVAFDVAAFTNLSQDHLDLHGDMEAYRDAKARLFAEHLAAGGVAVVNIDDAAGEHMLRAAGDRRALRVSARADADAEVRVVAAESTIAGITAVIATPRGAVEVMSRALVGAYNIANIAVAVAVAEALAIPHARIAAGVAAMPGVPGRVERVANDAGLDIVVDYAHTPDALANVLAALRPLTRRRLICVFGCGGDRDPKKRPLMGAEVAAGADVAVVTSDNPRTEDPQAILDMILPAVPEPFFVDTDRRAAIRAAVFEAVPGDVVLIAGKGHEDYQILGTGKIHFDDREEAAAACALRPGLPLDEILAATRARVVHRGGGGDGGSSGGGGGGGEAFSRVVIDGRVAAPGDLYVAIRGERFDGHDFCAQAVEAGARGVVVATGTGVPTGADGAPLAALVVEAEDPREALGRIAALWRRRWRDGGGKAVVAVTGSAGKTTTKELIAAALAPAGRVHRSRGSLNNETGVPLTLLGLRPHHDFGVVEMGMRGLGQIAYLAAIAEPDVGAVVNAGIAHVGVVGSVEAIARGKGEIYAGLAAGGTGIYPADDPRLAGYAEQAPRRLSFGEDEGADVRLVSCSPAGTGADIAIALGDAFTSSSFPSARAETGECVPVAFSLPGRHNARNAACAVAAAIAAGVPFKDAVRGLASARAASMRGEIARVAGRSVLVDCYNANPASMRAAFDTVSGLRGQARAIAVLGDMLELGDEAPAAHRDIGRAAAERGIDVIALGELAGDVVAGARAAGGAARVAADPAAAAADALAHTGAGDWILIKASRGMRLERVLEAMRTGEGA